MIRFLNFLCLKNEKNSAICKVYLYIFNWIFDKSLVFKQKTFAQFPQDLRDYLFNFYKFFFIFKLLKHKLNILIFTFLNYYVRSRIYDIKNRLTFYSNT